MYKIFQITLDCARFFVIPLHFTLQQYIIKSAQCTPWEVTCKRNMPLYITIFIKKRCKISHTCNHKLIALIFQMQSLAHVVPPHSCVEDGPTIGLLFGASIFWLSPAAREACFSFCCFAFRARRRNDIKSLMSFSR